MGYKSCLTDEVNLKAAAKRLFFFWPSRRGDADAASLNLTM